MHIEPEHIEPEHIEPDHIEPEQNNAGQQTPEHDDAGQSMSLEEWSTELVEELGLPADMIVDIPLILDLARDAAHSIARPAAPLTTFLVGFAAARAGGSTEDIRRLSKAASRRALDRREA